MVSRQLSQGFMYSTVSGVPSQRLCVFSTEISRERGKCALSDAHGRLYHPGRANRRAGSSSYAEDATQRRHAAGLIDKRMRVVAKDHLVAAPTMGQRSQVAHRAEATNRPASLPTRAAASSSSLMTVGSSPKTSSPTSARPSPAHRGGRM